MSDDVLLGLLLLVIYISSPANWWCFWNHPSYTDAVACCPSCWGTLACLRIRASILYRLHTVDHLNLPCAGCLLPACYGSRRAIQLVCCQVYWTYSLMALTCCIWSLLIMRPTNAVVSQSSLYLLRRFLCQPLHACLDVDVADSRYSIPLLT